MVDSASNSPELSSIDKNLSDFAQLQGQTVENKNESTWTKVSREAYVMGDGLAKGFGKGAEESLHDPLGTGLRVTTAIGVGVGLAVLSRGGAVPALIAEAAGTGMGLSLAWDVVKPDRLGALAQVAGDTWKSDENTRSNIDIVSDKLGRFSFDTALMSVGALGGAMAKGKPFFDAAAVHRPSGIPTYQEVTGGSYAAETKFVNGTGRYLPALEAFPGDGLVAPKYGRVLTASTLSLPVKDIQSLDQLTYVRPGVARPTHWEPTEHSIASRVEAQNFVKAFMAQDFHTALATSIEAPVMRRVDLNPDPKLQSVEIKADDLKKPEDLQYHMSQISKIGVFDWRQTTSGADVLQSTLKVKIPRTVVELNSGAKVALVDFERVKPDDEYSGYKVVYPNKTIDGKPLTAEQSAEIEGIRKSPEGTRVLAETSVIAFEESIAHANQHITNGGALISPSYARFSRDFAIEKGTRKHFLSFLGMLGKQDDAKVWFNEQEVPAILYDAGMPLPLIEHHYNFGGRHVEERAPLFDYLRKNEASSTYDYHAPQPEEPERD